MSYPINFIGEAFPESKEWQLDGPACHVCGAIMVEKDTVLQIVGMEKVWICLSCGATTEPS